MKTFHCGVLLAALALAGCAGLPPRDNADYAATWPDPPVEEAAANGSIYQTDRDVRLFENAVARRVGDVLTIVLAEKTDASKSAKTTTSKSTGIDLPGPTIAGAPVTVNGREILSASMDHATDFDGSGDSAQSNELTGNISVTVAKRLSNGNLLVRGQKWITINQGREFVRIQGIVRPVDITPQNTVASWKVADATISYGSQGVIDAANSKSLLARFFDSKWLPF